MKLLASCILATLSLSLVLVAKDFTGMYALVEKVNLEPNAKEPERIQIIGVFAKTDPKNPKEVSLTPQRGYLYFSLPDDPRMTSVIPEVRREWEDLKAVAGTGKVVGLGAGGYFATVRVRKIEERPSEPEPYPHTANLVLTRIRTDPEFGPIKSLLQYR